MLLHKKRGVRGYSIHGHVILIKFQCVCVWGGGLTMVLLGWLAASCSIFQRELITRVTMLCSITSA